MLGLGESLRRRDNKLFDNKPFGVTLEIIPNRLQQNTDYVDEGTPGVTSTAFLLDPMYLSQSFLHNVRVEPLAKTGLAEKRLLSADYMLKVLTEKSQGAIPAIDSTLPVTS